MKQYKKCVVIGYMNGCCFYQYDPKVAEFILYQLIPTVISLDNFYVGLQNYWAWKAQPQQLSDVPNLILLHTAYAQLYADLLPTLGYDFLSQFDEKQLISFYWQCVLFNIDISLENFLTNASHCISPFLALPLSNLKEDFFSSVKLKIRVENLVYTEKVRSKFLNFYLKMVKIIIFVF